MRGGVSTHLATLNEEHAGSLLDRDEMETCRKCRKAPAVEAVAEKKRAPLARIGRMALKVRVGPL
jgi:hypothetical protein